MPPEPRPVAPVAPGPGLTVFGARSGFPEVEPGDDLRGTRPRLPGGDARCPAARNRRRARGHPEGRVQGRGRHRRARRASSRGPRSSPSPSAGIATRGSSRSSCARRSASSAWRTASSSPRRPTASSAPTAGSTPATSDRPAATSSSSCPRIPTLPRQRSGRRSGTGTASMCPVVISDSFGRPWRWGIVDVAIGVSGPPADRGPPRLGRIAMAG